MIRAAIVAIALCAAGAASAQTESEFWYIGMSSSNGEEADAITFIDATRISTTGNTSRAWVTGYFSEASRRHDGIKHMRNLNEYDCVGRRSRTLQSTAYYWDVAHAPSTMSDVEDWTYVTPNTSGEWMLDFVCGSRDPSQYVRLRSGINLADAAEQLFEMQRANTQR